MSKVNFKNLQEREKKFAAAGLAILIVSVYFSRVFLPLKSEYMISNQKRDSVERKLRKEKSLLRKVSAMEKQYGQYMNWFGQKLSDAEQMSALVNEIESVAAQGNLKFSELKPNQV